jgi:hypothetical protein
MVGSCNVGGAVSAIMGFLFKKICLQVLSTWIDQVNWICSDEGWILFFRGVMHDSRVGSKCRDTLEGEAVIELNLSTKTIQFHGSLELANSILQYHPLIPLNLPLATLLVLAMPNTSPKQPRLVHGKPGCFEAHESSSRPLLKTNRSKTKPWLFLSGSVWPAWWSSD